MGEFVVNEILRSVSSGRSPVAGRGNFERLDKKYADKFKGGNRTPDLELDGDMLDSVEFKTTETGVEVGVFERSEQGKSDGHNNFSGLSKLPTRRFIADTSEQFNPRINRGIDQILSRYRVDSDPFTDIFQQELLLGAAVTQSQVDSGEAIVSQISIDEILKAFTGDIDGR